MIFNFFKKKPQINEDSLDNALLYQCSDILSKQIIKQMTLLLKYRLDINLRMPLMSSLSEQLGVQICSQSVGKIR